MVISFFVPGTPIPKGSMRAFSVRDWRCRYGTRPVVTHDNPKTKDWQETVAMVARAAAATKGLEEQWSGPVRMTVLFSLDRPKAHFKKNGQLKWTAPGFASVKPDLDKLVRSIFDALKGTIYCEDSRIVAVNARKEFVGNFSNQAGVEVEVTLIRMQEKL